MWGFCDAFSKTDIRNPLQVQNQLPTFMEYKDMKQNGIPK